MDRGAESARWENERDRTGESWKRGNEKADWDQDHPKGDAPITSKKCLRLRNGGKSGHRGIF